MKKKNALIQLDIIFFTQDLYEVGEFLRYARTVREDWVRRMKISQNLYLSAKSVIILDNTSATRLFNGVLFFICLFVPSLDI